VGRHPEVAGVKIATWNVEWFTNLFDGLDHVLADHHRSGRQGVSRSEQAEAVASVLRYLDADLILIVEAPDTGRKRSTLKALGNFARWANLRTSSAAMGFANETEQELAVMFDPDRVSVKHTPLGFPNGRRGHSRTPRFDTVLRLDLDDDGKEEIVTFSKPPLELTCKTARGHPFQLIGVHVKSKAPHGAKTDAEIVRLSVENRKKALGQSIWLRQRIDEHLSEHTSLVVLGDLNDGPGLDEFEKLFGRSSVEILMGEGEDNRLVEPHAMQALARKGSAQPTTSRFFLAHQNRYLEALLDYVMLSKDLAARNARWRILHPFDDPECFQNDRIRHALLTASDHFPVVVDLDL
jgi:endonuclease/exonuclease/phosphatase family metal-dependent hydrolase